MPVYTFRTNKGDEDVDEILSRIPVSARGWFFKEAVRFHAGLSDELKILNQNMQRRLCMFWLSIFNSSLNPA